MAKKRKKKRSATKRVSSALSRFLRKQNPSKMEGVSHVRVKKLKDGGITITPIKFASNPRRPKDGVALKKYIKAAEKRADNLNWHQMTRLLAGHSLTQIERKVFRTRLKMYEAPEAK